MVAIGCRHTSPARAQNRAGQISSLHYARVIVGRGFGSLGRAILCGEVLKGGKPADEGFEVTIHAPIGTIQKSL